MHLISCRHRTSGAYRARKSRTMGRRSRTELMFQVASEGMGDSKAGWWPAFMDRGPFGVKPREWWPGLAPELGQSGAPLYFHSGARPRGGGAAACPQPLIPIG